MENHLAIILYLVSLFFYYVAGIRLSKNNPNASQAFYLLASAQFLYGFTFINEALSLNFFRDSEYFNANDEFLKLISFAMILAMALITKNFILECGALILYFQAIFPFSNNNSFSLILIFINIILISASGIFTNMTAKISESACALVLIVITIFIASNISDRAEYSMKEALSADKISIILMVVNFVGLTLVLIFSKNKNYFEKKSLLCFLILTLIFFIPHRVTITICLHIISFSLAILMIFRGRFNAHILSSIIFCLMLYIIAIASVGRGGGSFLVGEGNGFLSFILLIIVAYIAQFYRKKSLKKIYKNDDQKT